MATIPADKASLLENWGWYYPDADVAQSLHEELQRELPPGHLLFGHSVETVAYRKDMDDVLFRHQDEQDRFTVIHLTWTMKREITDHPSVGFDGTFEQFFQGEEKFYQKK